MTLTTLGVVLIFLSNGCSLLAESQKSKDIRQKRIERRKQVQRLEQDLNRHLLSKGSSCRQIQEQYGDPDDAFLSGGSSTHFAVYTYEHIPADLSENEPDFNPIRLYCQDDQLIEWRL